MNPITISHPTGKIYTEVELPGSKSESNRLLILEALFKDSFNVSNYSNADDTQELIRILESNEDRINVKNAGTSMRFLTAYYCATKQHRVIMGSERMHQRPIKPLVDALRSMGFQINYLAEEGFPPLEVIPINEKPSNEVFIEGNISSQYITALMLIGAYQPGGIKIHVTTPLLSSSYVEMTDRLLNQFGIKCSYKDNEIIVSHGEPNNITYTVGADWSSASYWYSIAFLAKEAEITLHGLQDNWIQGDREIAEWMKRLGVSTVFSEGKTLIKKTTDSFPKLMKMNFANNPDLAQTFAGMFAAKNITTSFSGIESLKIKETDRVEAVRKVLQSAGVGFEYAELYDFYQLRGTFHLPTTPIETFNDHRMALSFAPWALLGQIQIDDADVVSKSYPGFWADIAKAGFSIS